MWSPPRGSTEDQAAACQRRQKRVFADTPLGLPGIVETLWFIDDVASGVSLSFASVSVTLRSPRVVVVIDGGAHWSYWVRRALYRAGRIWGGAGFAVVPHRNGKVDPVLLRACQAYDPDYVVTYHPTVGDLEHFNPGWFQIHSEDGALITGEERLRMLELARTRTVPLDTDLAARDQIAAVCSTYQTSEHVGWHEAVQFLDEDDGQRHFPSVLDMPSTWKGSVLACPADWGGILGAAVASHAGVAAPPSPSAGEPELTEQVRNEVASWLLGLPKATPPNELVWHPTTAVGIDTRNATTANDRTMTHLVPITTGHPFGQTGLLVVGDTAEDFALTRLWRLTFGEAYWLPSVLDIGQDFTPWQIHMAIGGIIREMVRHGRTPAITSVSLPESEVEQVHDRLRSAGLMAYPVAKPGAIIRIIADRDLPWSQPATVGLAVQDQWDSVVTVPVTVEETSTSIMSAPLPPPTLTHAELAIRGDMNWHVDVQWRPGRTVRRRGLDSRELFADRPMMMPTWARSSRDGTTYQAQRYNLVLAGTRPENRLARVALRDLSLQAWLTAKGAEHGFRVRPSEAGRRAMLLADMLGGRQPYTELFGGALLPALRAMLPTSATTSTAYPDHQGVALSAAEGVLSFAGVCARCPSLTQREVRQRLDAAAVAGVIRRGLVLRCAICEQKQFQTIGKLGQRWACQRCDALNDLDHPAWKAPADEPTWFYDLHPVARQVLRDNGDVPALLSSYLRNQRTTPPSNQFDDVAEVEFGKEGQPHVELDLVSYVDDVITVAECKASASNFAGRAAREEVAKKCRAATWLRADQLIFATKANSWASRSRSTIRTAIRQYSEWGPLGPPRVMLVSGLGNEHITAEDL